MTNDEIERLRPFIGKWVKVSRLDCQFIKGDKAFLCGVNEARCAVVNYDGEPGRFSIVAPYLIRGEWKEPRTINYEIVLWSDGRLCANTSSQFKIGDEWYTGGKNSPKVINIIKHTETIDE